MDPTDVPVPSAAEMRRNLRRKKILEGAKHRLEKLHYGSSSHETNHLDSVPGQPDSHDIGRYSDPEVEPDIPVCSPPSREENFLSLLDTTSPKPTANIYITSRCHVFVAAIVGFLVSLYSSTSIFLPAGLFAIAEIAFFHRQYRSNNWINAILPILLMYVNPSFGRITKNLNSFITIIYALIVDLTINIFCICTISYALYLLNIMDCQVRHI